MRLSDRLQDIKRRAHAVNLKMAGLCRLAGADYQLIHKWTVGVKGRLVDPKTSVAEREIALLEAALGREEARLLAELTGRSVAA